MTEMRNQHAAQLVATEAMKTIELVQAGAVVRVRAEQRDYLIDKLMRSLSSRKLRRGGSSSGSGNPLDAHSSRFGSFRDLSAFQMPSAAADGTASRAGLTQVRLARAARKAQRASTMLREYSLILLIMLLGCGPGGFDVHRGRRARVCRERAGALSHSSRAD